MFASLSLVSVLVFLLGHGQAYKMRWCTTSTEEQNKCGAFINVLNDSNVEPSCVKADSAIQCMEKIKNGDADLITLDGGEIYRAGKTYGMVPVVAEQYYSYGAYYYAVAVAKKNSDVTMKNLKGKMTCHTGAGKTSGWVVPIGFLLSKKYMEQDSSCNAYVSFGDYAKKSCIPNVKSPKIDTTGKNPSNLCELCPNECKAAGKYSGYSGAFKCLMDGVGEVAFVKHTTVMENVNASEADNYEYLCEDGTRNKIGQHLMCNLANVPSHAVMTSSGNNYKANYLGLLLKVSEDYGVKQNDSNMFQLYNSKKFGGKDLLFKDSTIKLVDATSSKSYKEYLGTNYMNDIEALDDCVSPSAASSDAKPYGFLASVVFMFVALMLS